MSTGILRGSYSRYIVTHPSFDKKTYDCLCNQQGYSLWMLHISECIGSDSHSSHFLQILHGSFLVGEAITQTWLGGWLVNEVGSNHILISIELTMTILSRLNSNSNPSEARSLSPFHRYSDPSLLHIDFLSSKIFHDSLLAITLSSASYRLLSSPSFWRSIGYPIPIVP